MKNIKSKKAKKNEVWSMKKIVFSVILFFLITIGLLFFQSYPNLQPVRDSIFYIITFKFIFSAIIVYFTWIHSSKPPLLGKILSSIIISTFWMSFIISSSQILLIIKTLMLLILIFYMIYIYINNEKNYWVLTAQVLLLGISYLYSSQNYAHINSPNGIHYWQISLVIGAMSAVIAVFLLLKEKIILKDNRFSERLMFPLVVFMLTFALVCSISYNLNYAFDSSEPTEYQAIIQDKKINFGFRSTTDYIFKLTVNETEIKLNVSQSEYYKYEIGESYPIKLYQGAFNDPYYISGNCK